MAVEGDDIKAAEIVPWPPAYHCDGIGTALPVGSVISEAAQ